MTDDNIFKIKARIASLERQLEDFRAYEATFIAGLPKSCLPADWSPLPAPGAITKLLKHLLTQEILKSMQIQKVFQFWFRFALVELLIILLLITTLILKS